MTGDKQCAVRNRPRDVQELRERIRELEDELRQHDPEEGHEWPQPDDPSGRS